MPLASLQCWLQYLSLSTMHVQLGCAHFLGWLMFILPDRGPESPSVSERLKHTAVLSN